MDSATWCRTPAAASAARRLRPEVSKNSSTALSSNEGELARSITPCAPAMASLSPSPVMVLTPVFGAAAIASCPFCFSFSTTFDPTKPVPPITTIFMTSPLMKFRDNGDTQAARHRVAFKGRFVDSPGWSSPTLRLLAGCCACAASGQAAAGPPTSVMNSRAAYQFPSSDDSIASTETGTLIGTETIGAVHSQCLRWVSVAFATTLALQPVYPPIAADLLQCPSRQSRAKCGDQGRSAIIYCRENVF